MEDLQLTAMLRATEGTLCTSEERRSRLVGSVPSRRGQRIKVSFAKTGLPQSSVRFFSNCSNTGVSKGKGKEGI